MMEGHVASIHAGTTDEELEALAAAHVRRLHWLAGLAGHPMPPASLYRDALEMARFEREARRREASHSFPGDIEVHGT
jgi:hypothetical protein